jgi:hypothetical protein
MTNNIPERINLFNNQMSTNIPQQFGFGDMTSQFPNFNPMNMGNMNIPNFHMNTHKPENMNMFMNPNFNPLMGMTNPIFLQSMNMMPGMMNDQYQTQMMNQIHKNTYEEQSQVFIYNIDSS